MPDLALDVRKAAELIAAHGEDLRDLDTSFAYDGVLLGGMESKRLAEWLAASESAESDPSEETAIHVDRDLRLAADVWRSAAPLSRGTIIFVHGFCGNRLENGLFSALGSHAARAGFNAISYDWRGIGDSDGDFPDTTMDEHVADFESVVSWAANDAEDESLPLYAVGFSLGAAVVGLALKEREAQLDSVAYVSPAVRPRLSMWPRYEALANDENLRRDGWVEKPGSSVKLGRAMLEALYDVDLGDDAFDLDLPLLVCHGTGDVRIDCGHTQKLVVDRGGDNRDFTYLECAGASHSFRPEERHWRLLSAALVGWLAGESPASVDA